MRCSSAEPHCLLLKFLLKNLGTFALLSRAELNQESRLKCKQASLSVFFNWNCKLLSLCFLQNRLLKWQLLVGIFPHITLMINEGSEELMTFLRLVFSCKIEANDPTSNATIFSRDEHLAFLQSTVNQPRISHDPCLCSRIFDTKFINGQMAVAQTDKQQSLISKLEEFYSSLPPPLHEARGWPMIQLLIFFKSWMGLREFKELSLISQANQ